MSPGFQLEAEAGVSEGTIRLDIQVTHSHDGKCCCDTVSRELTGAVGRDAGRTRGPSMWLGFLTAWRLRPWLSHVLLFSSFLISSSSTNRLQT